MFSNRLLNGIATIFLSLLVLFLIFVIALLLLGYGPLPNIDMFRQLAHDLSRQPQVSAIAEMPTFSEPNTSPTIQQVTYTEIEHETNIYQENDSYTYEPYYNIQNGHIYPQIPLHNDDYYQEQSIAYDPLNVDDYDDTYATRDSIFATVPDHVSTPEDEASNTNYHDSTEHAPYIPYPPATYIYLPYVPVPPITPPPLPPPMDQPQASVVRFDTLQFYIPENAHYYAAFYADNPHFTAEEIVWKVNAHLHLPFYYVIFVNEDPNPLLVNPFYRLPAGFTPAGMVPVNNQNCTLRAVPEAVTAFRALRATAAENGHNLVVASAFRTAGRQAQLFSARNYVDGVVARPYHSEHQTGRALDFGAPGGGLLDSRRSTPMGRWVAANAHYYGFILRYRAETTHITGFIFEPWHFTYVGVAISMYMHENNIMSLEEFIGRNPLHRLSW